MQTLDKAFKGSQSRAALKILDREEMNWRTAVRWAVAYGQHRSRRIWGKRSHAIYKCPAASANAMPGCRCFGTR